MNYGMGGVGFGRRPFRYRSRRPRLVCYPLSMEFRVEEQEDGEIIVTDGVFTAVYHKPDKLAPN